MSDLVGQYTERFNVVLNPMAESLQAFLDEHFGEDDEICRIETRPKAINSFLDKAARGDDGEKKYDDPLKQIQDQLGALLVTRFLSDVDAVSAKVDRLLSRIERKMIEPNSDSEFGYVGRHYILFIPSDVSTDSPIEFFELQIKTLFQYAWSETNHAIGYKGTATLNAEQRRLSAYVAAQAWGADRAVDELYGQVGTLTEDQLDHA